MPPDPAGNTDISRTFLEDCFTTPDGSPACDAAALSDFDKARASEGLAPMTLPTGFDSLSGAEQLLVLADIDRVDHGLSPVVGLSSALDGYAQQGADNNTDPGFPSYAAQGGSNWASPTSALISEFLWVYDDGVGSGNLDCQQAGDSGCWGHRHNVLYPWLAPRLMGAAQTSSDAELFLGDDTSDTADVATWASFAGDFPVGLSSTAIHLSGTTTSGSVHAWASGEAMKVTAAVTQGSGAWSVSPAACTLAAGHECRFTASRDAAGGASTGTLTVTGPNGSRAVTLTATKPSLTLAASGSGTSRGLAVHLSPSHAGTACTLSARYPGHPNWVKVRSTTLGAGGRHTFTVTLPKGASRLRAKAAGVTSNVVAVTVG